MSTSLIDSQAVRILVAFPVVAVAWFLPAEVFGLAGVVWFFIALSKFVKGSDE
jgi:hypothetical protein